MHGDTVTMHLIHSNRLNRGIHTGFLNCSNNFRYQVHPRTYLVVAGTYVALNFLFMIDADELVFQGRTIGSFVMSHSWWAVCERTRQGV